MKDGKFENHLEMYEYMKSGGKIKGISVIFGLNSDGNFVDQYGKLKGSPATEFTAVPSPAYYIPKDNSFAYQVMDGGKFKAVHFDGTEVTGTYASCDMLDLSKFTPVTKEQAERRVNSWWVLKYRSNGQEPLYLKIENGVASNRIGDGIDKHWAEYDTIDKAFDSIKALRFIPITRAECEAAFRTTFNLFEAVRRAYDGETVRFQNDPSFDVMEAKFENGIMVAKSTRSNAWVPFVVDSSAYKMKYWLAK